MSRNHNKRNPLPPHIQQRLCDIAVEEGMTEEQYAKYKRSMRKVAARATESGKKALLKIVTIPGEVKPRAKQSKKNGHIAIPASLSSIPSKRTRHYPADPGLKSRLS